jgi:ribosomal protein S8
MTKSKRIRTALAFIGIMAAFFVLVNGCAGLKSSKKDSEFSTKEQKETHPLYCDFGDVLVPGELKVEKNLTFVLETSGFITGVNAYKGRVKVDSLIKFFKSSMVKDNWRILGSFKSSPLTIMLFQKENRSCLIKIIEKLTTTHVEIWVAPSINEVETGLLK